MKIDIEKLITEDFIKSYKIYFEKCRKKFRDNIDPILSYQNNQRVYLDEYPEQEELREDYLYWQHLRKLWEKGHDCIYISPQTIRFLRKNNDKSKK